MDVLLHDRELDLMEVLWERRSATVAEVRAALEADLAYNTVLTMLRRMEDKGYVRREEEGRAHRYFPVIERLEARTGALRRVLDRAFGGSPELLLTQLISERKLSPSQIRRLKEVLHEHLPEEER
jgi:predicted transcriptional regulator